MPKIRWQNSRSSLDRRAEYVQQAPYYDSKSYQTYRDFLDTVEAQKQGAETPEEAAAIEQQSVMGLREMRQEAGEQPKRIGYHGADYDSKNYQRYAEYELDDPNRPAMPEGSSGPSSGGGGGSDLRTDTDMVQMAKTGDLKGFKDRRSRGYNALFGPGGPLSGGYTHEELEANPKIKGLRDALKKVMDATPTPRKTQVDFVNMPFPINTSKEAAAVEAYLKMMEKSKGGFTLKGGMNRARSGY